MKLQIRVQHLEEAIRKRTKMAESWPKYSPLDSGSQSLDNFLKLPNSNFFS